MKTSFLCLTLLFSPHLFSQNLDSLSKWQFGVNYSQDGCYRQLIDEDGTASGVIVFREQWELPKLSFTAGVNALYALNNHFSLGFGVQYSNKGYQLKVDQIYIDQTNGEPVAGKYHSVYNMHYVDVPVSLIFSAGEGNWHFISSIGIAGNVFLQETVKSTLTYDGNEETNESVSDYEYKFFTLTPMLSAGVCYDLTENSSLRLDPTFRYGITKIIDAPVSARLYSLGLNLSYFMSF